MGRLIWFLHKLEPCRIAVPLALLAIRQRHMGLEDVGLRRVKLL
jgi:hypothetical protein